MAASSSNVADGTIPRVDGNGSPVADSKALNMDLVLETEDLCKVFREYLEGKCAEENLDAWKEFEQFKSEVFSSETERVKTCERICNKYIVEGAPHQVNINHYARTRIEQSIPDKVTPHIFDEAQKEIYVLMLQDCLPKFLNSTNYREFCSQQKRSLSSPDLSSSPRLGSSPKSISWNGKSSKRTYKIFGKELTDLPPFSPPSSPFSRLGLNSPRASSPIHSRKVKLRNRSGSLSGRKMLT